ncbi:MAG: Uma2 family endonuclease [Caldilineaceae bacterium SB0662_bin_25]|nr:Uma2 family endonuclease [Caldilineaceae bacterium SB0662_bin_25]
MVTQAPAKPATGESSPRGRPPLASGDRLSRAEFHRRYSLYPEIKKAELVDGVVIVGATVYAQHSEIHADFSTILGFYRAHTSGLRVADNQSVIVDDQNEIQPDLCVRFKVPSGGGVERTEEGLYVGAPEFVVEVAASSAAYDVHSKLELYRRSGVGEYFVVLAYEREVRLFRLADGVYELIRPDEDGVLRSRVLPGFWFRADWFWEGRVAELIEPVEEGIASPEHREFVARLTAG